MKEEQLHICGGKALKGEITVSGAKNAVTKLLIASLLSDQPCHFSQVPQITEVELTVDLCREIGMQVEWDREDGQMRVCTPELATSYVPQKYCGANRIPILLIGALLGRTTEDIIVPTVGGCALGQRPVDFHTEALRALGAEIEYRKMKREGAYFARAHRGLKGTTITLPYPSVGATENVILASIRAEGTTLVHNAAIEPEIVDLVLFLQKLGARLSFRGHRTICIEGDRSAFSPVHHTVLPDRIAVASFAIAALATGGDILVRRARQRDLLSFLHYVRNLGGEFTVEEEGIRFFAQGPLQGNIHLATDVYPGFMTDCQQPLVALLSQVEGTSIVHETVYENRFGYVEMLQQMGADIATFSHCLGSEPCRYHQKNFLHSLVIRGPTPLVGQSIRIPDLRAGFACIVAALVAKGESTLQGVHFLYRGYENPVEALYQLGAQISLKKIESTQ